MKIQFYENEVRLMSKKDAFMRGIRDFLEIEDINSNSAKVLLNHKEGSSDKSKVVILE